MARQPLTDTLSLALDAEQVAALPSLDLLVPLAAVRRILQVFPRDTTTLAAQLRWESQATTEWADRLTVHHEESTLSVAVTRDQWIPFDRIFGAAAAKPPAATAVAFTPRMLERFKAASIPPDQTSERWARSLRVRFTGERSPVLVDIAGGDFVGVVMPRTWDPDEFDGPTLLKQLTP